MQKLDIGNSDFKDIILNQRYYVDKTVLIRDVIDGSKVTLLPRPRRFGKTLNMTMLRYFFEKTTESNAALFHGLKIADDGDAMQHQGQYPVIYLSLKNIKGTSWTECKELFQRLLSTLYNQHKAIANSIENKVDAKFFTTILNGEASITQLKSSLEQLVSLLYAHYNRPVVILIDEYDSPVIEAYQKGYYDEMIDFMRLWLGGGLKHVDGQATFRAVITGILRITRESIFSDLNNLKVASILTSGSFADKFGFTESEVIKMLNDFKLSSHLSEVQSWYNGYKFGEHSTIYNPWSMVNFVDNAPTPIGPQWLNTSSNALVHHELELGGLELKRDLEKLLQDRELRYPITEHTIFDDIGTNPQNIWSFLCFAGYLNATQPRTNPMRRTEMTYNLSIPNLEVSLVYEQFIERWQHKLKFNGNNNLAMALIKEQYNEFELLLNELICNLVSYHDVARYPEAAYHCFVLGLLASMRTVYDISSNPESGYGRADIIMRSKSPNCPLSFVIEFKVIEKSASVETAIASALQQIEEKSYASRLLEADIAPESIRKLAVVIQGNSAVVKARQ